MNKENYSYPFPKLTPEEREEIQKKIADIRANYTWEQKMELKLLEMHFMLEEWYGEWRAERERRKKEKS